MTHLLDLAARIEAAGEDEQRYLLTQAFYALNPAPEIGTAERGAWVAASERFHRLGDVGAYVDAAIMLVPEPESTFWRVGHDGEGGDPSLFLATIFTPRVDRAPRPHDGVAITPALALTAAALRAHAAGREEG